MSQGISNTGREKKRHFQWREFLGRLCHLLKCLRNRMKKSKVSDASVTDELKTEEPWENPYLDDFRNILLQILAQRDMEFGDFHPILIDSDEREQSFLTEEDTVRLLAQIGEGLNALEILTDRPEYFKSFSARMNAEYGLLTQIYPRDYRGSLLGNVVLDLERHSRLDVQRWADKSLYIPFYKRRWKQGNLDIEVPIGYNIVIVKTEISDIQNRL